MEYRRQGDEAFYYLQVAVSGTRAALLLYAAFLFIAVSCTGMADAGAGDGIEIPDAAWGQRQWSRHHYIADGSEAVGIGAAGHQPDRRSLRGALRANGARRANSRAAINAGMFSTDGKTHVGYMRSGDHVNSSKHNSYQSVAAFNPRDASEATFRIFDLDAPGVTLDGHFERLRFGGAESAADQKTGREFLADPGKEVERGGTRRGRCRANPVYFFARAVFHARFESGVARRGIGIVAAQHLEGGPEAQLYFRAGGVEKEMCGSYETSFRENDANAIPWPIPNVLAVRLRQTTVH